MPKEKVINSYSKNSSAFSKLRTITLLWQSKYNKAVIILSDEGPCINQQTIHLKQQTSLISPTTSNNNNQQILELHIEKKDVVEAEIRWVLHAVISGISDNSSDKIGNLF